MNPPRIADITYWPRHRGACMLVVLLALAAGCVYRPNIQQGNLLRVEDVDQVTVGMTRSQVRYVLGTPMISDPFNPDRWDYIYTLQRGHERHVDRSHLVVIFDGDRVSKIEKLSVPKEANAAGSKGSQDKKDAGHEPPPAPSISEPQPDSPRPGSTTKH